MTPTRKPPPTPAGTITDRDVFWALVAGSEWATGWWESHAPELAVERRLFSHDRDETMRLIQEWRQQQVERVSFLLDGGYLAGAALEEAIKRRTAMTKAGYRTKGEKHE